jgi:hypothetical protein
MVPFAKATSTNSDVAVTAMGSDVTGRIPPFSNKSICSTLTIVTRLPPRSPRPQRHLWQPCRTPHVFLVPRREQGVDMCRHSCALTAEHVARAAQTGTDRTHWLGASVLDATHQQLEQGAGVDDGLRPCTHCPQNCIHTHLAPFLLANDKLLECLNRHRDQIEGDSSTRSHCLPTSAVEWSVPIALHGIRHCI